MTPEQFRHAGRRTIDWIAHSLETIERHPVLSRVARGEIRRRLPPRAPERGEPFDAILQDLDDVILPGITHWQSPNFFAYFPANASPPAILGDLVSAGLGVQGMLWATSPACTELEQHVLDWLADLLDLPAAFRSDGPGGGVIQDTASTAILTALLAALHRASAGAVPPHGGAGVAAGGPERRWLNDGLAFADSYCTNPHKWLLTNFDCDAFYVAGRRPLLGALSILPEFLRNAATESGAVVDSRDWHVQLGRRFR